MQTHLAALAHASVLQLRDAFRRVTVMHASPVQKLDDKAFLARVDVADSGWGDWQETNFDVRIHA